MGLLTSRRASAVGRPADEVWDVVAAAGPGPHWYADAAAFRFRALVDRAVGGTRPVPAPDRDLLREGDRAGFWRVLRAEAVGGQRVLVLEARVRAPGEVRFRTAVEPVPGGCRLVQEVSFRPAGALGAAYLVADLPAREALLTAVHRRTLADVRRP